MPSSFRFPIGLTEQVKTWEHSVVQNFWRKWYFPANITLYIVGDLDRSVEEVTRLIEAAFGRFPAGNLGDHGADVAAAVLGRLTGSSNGDHSDCNGSGSDVPVHRNGNGAAASTALVPARVVADADIADASSWARRVIINGSNSNVLGEGVLAVSETGSKVRHPVRPPVVHRHGCGALQPGEPPVPVSIFRHPLLQHFMLTVFCKLPVVSLVSMDDLKYSFMVRLILSAFQFRVNQR